MEPGSALNTRSVFRKYPQVPTWKIHPKWKVVSIRKSSFANPHSLDQKMAGETVGIGFRSICPSLEAELNSQSPNHPTPGQVFQGLFFLFPDGARHRLGQEAEAAVNAHSAQAWTPWLFPGRVL